MIGGSHNQYEAVLFSIPADTPCVYDILSKLQTILFSIPADTLCVYGILSKLHSQTLSVSVKVGLNSTVGKRKPARLASVQRSPCVRGLRGQGGSGF